MCILCVLTPSHHLNRKFNKLLAPVGTCYCSEQGVAWALQLSDLHLSVYNKHWLPQYGDKEGDLQ